VSLVRFRIDNDPLRLRLVLLLLLSCWVYGVEDLYIPLVQREDIVIVRILSDCLGLCLRNGRKLLGLAAAVRQGTATVQCLQVRDAIVVAGHVQGVEALFWVASHAGAVLFFREGNCVVQGWQLIAPGDHVAELALSRFHRSQVVVTLEQLLLLIIDRIKTSGSFRHHGIRLSDRDPTVSGYLL